MNGIFSCRITGDELDAPQAAGAEIFPYWSFTKTVIAICALRLVERGRLDLDAQVTGFDFSLRQLLNHTSGLPDYGALAEYRKAVLRDDEPWTAEQLFDAAMAEGRLFEPGKGWAYSNVGYMLARDLVEDAAGDDFAGVLARMICRPLGLDSIALATSRQDFARVLWPAAKGYHPGWVYHGCLTGTAADAARLLHGLFAGRLLNAATQRQMLVRYPLGGAITGRPWTECGYALGLMSGQCARNGRMIGHSGGGPFSVNAVYHFPDLEVPVTAASFSDAQDEAVAEFAAVECAAKE